MKDPRSKIQDPDKLQTQNTKDARSALERGDLSPLLAGDSLPSFCECADLPSTLQLSEEPLLRGSVWPTSRPGEESGDKSPPFKARCLKFGVWCLFGVRCFRRDRGGHDESSGAPLSASSTLLPEVRADSARWCLDLGVSLELGSWCLELLDQSLVTSTATRNL
jgi:hypothetical protein